jgi:hypothetical protein
VDERGVGFLSAASAASVLPNLTPDAVVTRRGHQRTLPPGFRHQGRKIHDRGVEACRDDSFEPSVSLTWSPKTALDSQDKTPSVPGDDDIPILRLPPCRFVVRQEKPSAMLSDGKARSLADVDPDMRIVSVGAVGIKDHNTLYVRGRVFHL